MCIPADQGSWSPHPFLVCIRVSLSTTQGAVFAPRLRQSWDCRTLPLLWVPPQQKELLGPPGSPGSSGLSAAHMGRMDLGMQKCHARLNSFSSMVSLAASTGTLLGQGATPQIVDKWLVSFQFASTSRIFLWLCVGAPAACELRWDNGRGCWPGDVRSKKLGIAQGPSSGTLA